MKTPTRDTEAALEDTPTVTSRATHKQPQLSVAGRRDQDPWLDPEEEIWKGCGFYFDGCSCPRCEEAELRNQLNRKLCEALDLPQGQYSPEELQEQLNQTLNGLAKWVERRGYLNDQDGEEGRQYARLCEVLEVAPGMKHSRHYWELKLNRLLKEVS